MRGSFVFVVTIATIAPSTLSARSDGIPTLDIRPVCRGIASQSADPGIGQGGQAETFQRCVESEQAVREEIKKKWPAFSAADKQHCVTLAKTGGESSNTELLTCLEMARDVRILRSTARAVSGEDLTKPASSLSMPAVQEDLARTASPPVPAAEGQKTDLPSKEVEQAKPNAAESEATAQRAEELDRLIESSTAVNGKLSRDDIRVLPLLRSAAVVKGLRFPRKVRDYFETMMELVGYQPLPAV